MYAMCCIHVVTLTMTFHIAEIATTIHETDKRQFRRRRREPCWDAFALSDDVYDINYSKRLKCTTAHDAKSCA